MVILEYADIEPDLWVTTPSGLIQAIQFQNRYYAIRKSYKLFQDAVHDCRKEIEKGFCSIIVSHADRVEIWDQLADDVSTRPMIVEQLPVTVEPECYYRGQKIKQIKQVSQPISSPVIEQLPVTIEPECYYRGQKVKHASAQSAKPASQPDAKGNVFYRGVKLT